MVHRRARGQHTLTVEELAIEGGDSPAEVDNLVEDEGHDTGGKDGVADPEVPLGPPLLEDVEGVKVGALVEVGWIGGGGSGGRGGCSLGCDRRVGGEGLDPRLKEVHLWASVLRSGRERLRSEQEREEG